MTKYVEIPKHLLNDPESILVDILDNGMLDFEIDDLARQGEEGDLIGIEGVLGYIKFNGQQLTGVQSNPIGSDGKKQVEVVLLNGRAGESKFIDVSSLPLDVVKHHRPFLERHGMGLEEPGLSEEQPERLTEEEILDTLNNVGVANRLIAEYGEQIIYVTGLGWFYWNGKYWEQNEKPIYKMIIDVLTTIRTVEAKTYLSDLSIKSDVIEKVTRYSSRSKSNKEIKSVLETASFLHYIDIKELDTNPYLLNLQNGIYNFETGEFLEHDPKYKLTSISNYTYDPDYADDSCMSIIERILPDPDIQDYMWRVLAYAHTGLYDDKVFSFWYNSEGDNGKTTLAEIFKSLLGSYSVSMDVSVFQVGRDGSFKPRPELLQMIGKRLCVVSEAHSGAKLNTTFIKLLTGGDTISGRTLYSKDMVEFINRAKIVMFGNSKPRIPETNQAIWNRLRLVNFTEIIPKNEQIPLERILQMFLEHSPAVLNKIIESWGKYRAVGLHAPKQVMLATEEYQTDEDSLIQFVNDYCEMDDSVRILATEFRAFYQKRTKETISAKALYNRLGKLYGIEKGGQGRRYLLGIHIVDPVVDSSDYEPVDLLFKNK